MTVVVVVEVGVLATVHVAVVTEMYWVLIDCHGVVLGAQLGQTVVYCVSTTTCGCRYDVGVVVQGSGAGAAARGSRAGASCRSESECAEDMMVSAASVALVKLGIWKRTHSARKRRSGPTGVELEEVVVGM